MAFRGHTALEGLRARDPVALRAVVDEHGRRLYRAARGMGFSPGDSEDLAQEVFVTFLETLDRFEGRSEVGTWLFGILHHKAQERRRAHAREELSDALDEAFDARFNANGSWRDPPIPADRIVAAGQTADALRDCLAGLPAQHREVFQLRQLEGVIGERGQRAAGLHHQPRGGHVSPGACPFARVLGDEGLGTIAMMTCKEVSTLVSMAQIDEAPLARRMGVWLHLMMCRHCRRFWRQLLRMGRIAGLIADDFEREPTSGFEGRILDRLGS